MPEAGACGDPQPIPPAFGAPFPTPELQTLQDAILKQDAVNDIPKPPPSVYDSAFKAQELLKKEQAEKSAIPPALLTTLENWFSYHPPKDEAQIKQYAEVRAAGLAFAKVICTHAPSGADRTAAIRLVREAVFTTNAAIACGGK